MPPTQLVHVNDHMNSPIRVRVACAEHALRSGPGPIVVPAALYDVAAELPLLAGSSTIGLRPNADVHD